MILTSLDIDKYQYQRRRLADEAIGATHDELVLLRPGLLRPRLLLSRS